MERALEPALLAQSRETGWSLAAAFAVMVVLFAVGPFVVYPVFLMKALCFSLFACAFNLVDRLCRPGLVRPCLVLRLGELRHRLYGEDLGLAARACDRRRHRDRPRCSASWPAGSPFAGRASTSP